MCFTSPSSASAAAKVSSNSTGLCTHKLPLLSRSTAILPPAPNPALVQVEDVAIGFKGVEQKGDTVGVKVQLHSEVARVWGMAEGMADFHEVAGQKEGKAYCL